MVIYCLYRSVWPASCFFFLKQRRNCKAGDGVSMSIPTSLCPLIIDCCVLTPDSRCACACLKLIALWSIMNEYGCTQNIYQRHRWSWLLMLNIWSCLKAIKPTLNTTSLTSAGSWICREQRHRNTFAGGWTKIKIPLALSLHTGRLWGLNAVIARWVVEFDTGSSLKVRLALWVTTACQRTPPLKLVKQAASLIFHHFCWRQCETFVGWRNSHIYICRTYFFVCAEFKYQTLQTFMWFQHDIKSWITRVSPQKLYANIMWQILSVCLHVYI